MIDQPKDGHVRYSGLILKFHHKEKCHLFLNPLRHKTTSKHYNSISVVIIVLIRILDYSIKKKQVLMKQKYINA